jgi:hypothetical protein
MEKQKDFENLKPKKKNQAIQYETLDAALKSKNDMARNYLKTAKLP